MEPYQLQVEENQERLECSISRGFMQTSILRVRCSWHYGVRGSMQGAWGRLINLGRDAPGRLAKFLKMINGPREGYGNRKAYNLHRR